MAVSRRDAVILVVLVALAVPLALYITSQTAVKATGKTTASVEFCLNSPPVFAAVADQAAVVGQPFSLTINATDPDNGAITYRDNTDLFEIGATTGAISFTPSTAGTFAIAITASDNSSCQNQNASTSFTLRITAVTPSEAARRRRIEMGPPELFLGELSTIPTSFSPYVGQLVVYLLNGVRHTVTASRVSATEAAVVLDSKLSLVLHPGEAKDADITGDGSADVQITLKTITRGMALLEIAKLAAQPVVPPIVPAPAPVKPILPVPEKPEAFVEELAPTQPTAPPTAKMLPLLYATAVLAVLAIAAALIIIPSRLMIARRLAKARRLVDKGAISNADVYLLGKVEPPLRAKWTKMRDTRRDRQLLQEYFRLKANIARAKAAQSPALAPEYKAAAARYDKEAAKLGNTPAR